MTITEFPRFEAPQWQADEKALESFVWISPDRGVPFRIPAKDELTANILYTAGLPLAHDLLALDNFENLHSEAIVALTEEADIWTEYLHDFEATDALTYLVEVHLTPDALEFHYDDPSNYLGQKGQVWVVRFFLDNTDTEVDSHR